MRIVLEHAGHRLETEVSIPAGNTTHADLAALADDIAILARERLWRYNGPRFLLPAEANRVRCYSDGTPAEAPQ